MGETQPIALAASRRPRVSSGRDLSTQARGRKRMEGTPPGRKLAAWRAPVRVR